MSNVLVFGEILWDVFSENKVIGGAPFNFAAHLSALGIKSFLISAVGYDALGELTVQCINEKNVDSTFTKTVSKPTGVCNVTLDTAGTPSYNLLQDVAYDNIILTDDEFAQIDSIEDKCLYAGSLSLRNNVSFNTFKNLVNNCQWKDIFFDINIRQHYYNRDVVEFCLSSCTVLKFSREEAYVFSELGLSEFNEDDLEALCIDIADKYDINIVLLTLDKDGGAVYMADTDTFIYSEKPCCNVVSTVGAGDSFFAAYINAYLNSMRPEKCLRHAIAVSGYVVEHIEAIPVYDDFLKKQIYIK